MNTDCNYRLITALNVIYQCIGQLYSQLGPLTTIQGPTLPACKLTNLTIKQARSHDFILSLQILREI
jgi:hypothetical protein